MRQRREPPQHHRPLTPRCPSHTHPSRPPIPRFPSRTTPCRSAVTACTSALHALPLSRHRPLLCAPRPAAQPSPPAPLRIAPPPLRTIVISFGGYSYTLCTPRPSRPPIPRFPSRIAHTPSAHLRYRIRGAALTPFRNTYIGFAQKVYTSRAKLIYLSSETYIPFARYSEYNC